MEKKLLAALVIAIVAVAVLIGVYRAVTGNAEDSINNSVPNFEQRKSGDWPVSRCLECGERALPKTQQPLQLQV